MKTGLFGGTFNPFHNGHMEIIQYVKKKYQFNRIFLIPSATPPHKPDINLAPATDRFEMVKQSLKNHKNFCVSSKELIRQGPSFTIDTINEFQKELGSRMKFYLLMGSDSFLDIPTWKNRDEIFEAVPVIIMLRGYWKNLNTISSFIYENISKKYQLDKQDNTFYHKNKQKIMICRVPKIDISSTCIRERVKKKEPIKELVPANVEKIIRTKELYK